SRRRHTRFSRDWSSDVCSSDLVAADFELDVAAHSRVLQQRDGGALALDIAVDEYPARIELRTVAELDVAVDPDAGFKNASGVVGHPPVVDLAAAGAEIEGESTRLNPSHVNSSSAVSCLNT